MSHPPRRTSSSEPAAIAQPPGREASRARTQFSIGAGVGFTAICLTVWLTGLRAALHGVVLAAGAVALLPFLIMAAGVLVLCAAAALAALAEGAGDFFAVGGADGIAAGGKLIGPYYRLLWGVRHHAVPWGLGAGVGFGTALLALVLWFYVVPREAKTLAILLDAKVQIDASYGSKGLEEPWVDAFGRPVEYHRPSPWSYVLISRGSDGKESADDICVVGRVRGAAILTDILKHPIETLKRLRQGKLGAAESAQMVRDMRCERVREDPQ